MSNDKGAFTAKDGALWVFPDGPNHEPQYIACTDADDIAEPLGDVELIRCFNVWGGYKVVGEKISPPDPVKTTLTSLTFKTRTWLERIRGQYGLMFLQRDGGRADTFTNYQRALILADARNTEKTYGGVLKRETDDETTRGFSITASPPVIQVVEVTGTRIASLEPYAFRDVAMLKTDEGILPVKYGVAVADGFAAIKGKVWVTSDGGQTWTDTAAQPFAVAMHNVACAILDMGNNVRRIIVGMGAPAGAQGMTAYSDDWGATWTVVNVGGAAAGHGVTKGGGIFALDEHHIWLAGAAGYIYFSSNGGQSWTAQDAGIATAGAYTKIKFTDDGIYGYAVAAAGIVVKTSDGGSNWIATTATITAVPALTALCVRDEDFVWVGTATGGLWFTEDGGTTWTQRTGWVGSAIGSVNSIAFANDYVGFMLADTAAPVGYILRTIDGGYTWQRITADVNSGLTTLAVGDENYINYVGLINAATGFIGVLSE